MRAALLMSWNSGSFRCRGNIYFLLVERLPAKNGQHSGCCHRSLSSIHLGEVSNGGPMQGSLILSHHIATFAAYKKIQIFGYFAGAYF